MTNDTETKEEMLTRFISSRPSIPAVSEEDIMNEVKVVRYDKFRPLRK